MSFRQPKAPLPLLSQTNRTLGRIKLTSLAILTLGIAASLLLAWNLWQAATASAEQRFAQRVDQLQANLRNGFDKATLGLQSLVGIHGADGHFTRETFHAYWAARGFTRDFPGIRGFGYIERVPRSEMAAYLGQQRRANVADFQIKTSGNADPMYVITLIEPVEDNRPALGLDLASEAVRHAGARKAVRSGRATLTGAITLLQDQQRGSGFLLLVPLYAGGRTPETVAEREAMHMGFAYSPVVAQEILGALSGLSEGDVKFNIYAEGTDGEDVEVFRSQDTVAGGGRYRRDVSFTLADLPFRLNARSTAAFDASTSHGRAVFIGAGGILVSALLALAFWSMVSARTRAEARALELTSELQRLANIARRTSDAVIITDIEGRISWVNQAFTRISGYSAEEALGHKPGTLLQSDQSDPHTIATISGHLARRETCQVEILNRHKDGHHYWLDLEIQPLYDEAMHLQGFMAVERDITLLRETQQRERAHAEQLAAALRETDALMSTINVQAIVSEADRDGRILRVNPAFCRISGYGEDELVGRDHRIVNSGVHDRAFWIEMWQTITEGRPWRGQICNRAKDGSLYWVDSIIAPFLDEQGEIEKYISIRFDITRAHENEVELERERQHLQSILEGTNVGTWEWNIQSGQALFNNRWAEIIGYRLEELEPVSIDTWNRLVHPDDLRQSGELLEKHFAGGTDLYECEVRMRHKDGHWVWVLSRGKLLERDGGGRPLRMAGTHMDIGSRKQLEFSLRDSQEMLERAGQIAGIGSWHLDLTNNALHWSAQTRRIHDVPPDFQPTLENAVSFYPPQARQEILRLVEASIGTGQPYDIELPLVTATGRSIWVRAVGQPEFLDGKPVRLIGAFQDITQRHDLEQRVRNQNELLTAIINNLPVGLSVFDADLNMTLHNRAFQTMLELPDSLFEPTPVPFERIIRFNAERGEYGPGNTDEIVQSIVERAMHPVPHLFERARPNGRTLEVRGGPMPGGGLITAYTDITERKQAALEARRADEMLRQAIDALDQAFVLYDADDRLVLCNQRYRDTYPLSAPLMKPGASFEDLVRFGAEHGEYPAAVGRVNEWVAERVRQHQRADTDLVQELSSGRILRIVERKTSDGMIVGFRIDITDLIKAKQSAEQASQAKSQFLANMSHEIRTPMNAILGMLSLLQNTDLTVRQQDYVSKTEGAAKALLGLLNDILDFSKVEAGKMTLEQIPFRIDQLLRDLSVILSANTGNKALEVLFDIDPRLPNALVGDSLRLKQVLINLGGNAIKFTEQGMVVVRIEVQDLRTDRVSLRFAVRDTGIGIQPDQLQRIFEGFSQAETSTTRRFGGTGLGLAISARLVKLMGGQLQVESEAGRGSQFYFDITLPVEKDSGAVIEAPSPIDMRQLQVLVIDDNPTARQVLQSMLEPMGWAVDVAGSGEEALDRIQQRLQQKQHPYDAIFVDWQMPGMDGWETSLRIRRLHTTTQSPILVMVTAQGREMLFKRPAEEQAQLNGFLVKPVTPSMLFDAVSDARHRRTGNSRPTLAKSPVGQRLQGMRVLLVEDNKVNQQVAQELLEREGALVTLADNGALGVQAIASTDTPWDVVLMDVQMPVMDGYTAARKVRQELVQTALPIIAMTANAMEKDRQDALAAGMNAHVGKPFNLDELVSTMLACSGFQPGHAAAISLPEPEPAPSDMPAATAELDLPDAWKRLGGDMALLARVLQWFADDVPRRPHELATLLATGRVDDARRLLHTLKGTAATVGAMRLATTADEGEQLLRDGTVPAEAEVVQLNERISAAVQAVVEDLAPALHALQAQQKPPDTPATPPHPSELHHDLEKLQALLHNFDMGSLEAYAELRRRHGDALQQEIEALDGAMSQLDFEQAARLCEQLQQRHTS